MRNIIRLIDESDGISLGIIMTDTDTFTIERLFKKYTKDWHRANSLADQEEYINAKDFCNYLRVRSFGAEVVSLQEVMG